METKPSFYIPRWIDTLHFDDSHPWLGRIVHSYRDPYFDHIPRSLDSIADACVTVHEASNYGEVEFCFESSIPPMNWIRRLFKGRSTYNDGNVAASKVKRYRLRNERQVLENLLAEEESKEKLE